MAARPTSAAAVQQGAGSHPRGLHPAPATTSTTGSPTVPVYTPYQLPPLLQTAAAAASVNAAGQYSATTPSPASAFPLDPRLQPPAFSTTLEPGLPRLGSMPAGDLPVQHSNRGLDALMNLHGMGSRDLAGPSGGSGGDHSFAPTDSLNGGAELPPKVVQKADRSCKKYVRNPSTGQLVCACPERPPKLRTESDIDAAFSRCRERRVRCGREVRLVPLRERASLSSLTPKRNYQFPSCARCKKRRDTCSYGEGVYVCVKFAMWHRGLQDR